MGCGLSYPFRGNRARVSDTLAAAPALSGSRPSAEMGQRRRDVHVVHRRRSAKTRSVNPRKLLQSTDKTAVSALQQPLPLKAGTKVMGVQEGMNTNDIPAEVLVAMDNIAGSVRACKTPLQSAYVSMTSLSDRDSGYKEETFSARRLLTEGIVLGESISTSGSPAAAERSADPAQENRDPTSDAESPIASSQSSSRSMDVYSPLEPTCQPCANQRLSNLCSCGFSHAKTDGYVETYDDGYVDSSYEELRSYCGKGSMFSLDILCHTALDGSLKPKKIPLHVHTPVKPTGLQEAAGPPIQATVLDSLIIRPSQHFRPRPSHPHFKANHQDLYERSRDYLYSQRTTPWGMGFPSVSDQPYGHSHSSGLYQHPSLGLGSLASSKIRPGLYPGSGLAESKAASPRCRSAQAPIFDDYEIKSLHDNRN